MQKIIVKKQILNMVVMILIISLNGCASSYPCGEPNAGTCSSVSENFQQSFNDYKNSDDLSKDNGSLFGTAKPAKIFKFAQYKQIPENGAPLISQPTMIRLWLTPYTDSDNIYHEQGYEFILTDKGHWLYGNNNQKINNNIKNIFLTQGLNNKINNSDGSFGLPVSPTPSSNKSINPNALLKDYPALNALQNQSINKTITPSANGTTTIYAH